MINMILRIGLLLGLGLAAPVLQGEIVKPAAEMVPTDKPRHVILIGASIGQQWNLSELPQRMNERRYTFEALQAWQYDKSEVVDETLMRPSRKFRLSMGYLNGFLRPAPETANLIILKECSSYFPSDMQRNKDYMRRWVQEIRQKNIPVMLATVVPVTRERALRDPGKQEALREFNDWLRAYTQQEGLPLLDLEQALRTDDKQRYLRDDLTSGDGSHLNHKAYDILDQQLIKSVSILLPAR
jgi:hypothetical protein